MSELTDVVSALDPNELSIVTKFLSDVAATLDRISIADKP